MCLQCESGAVAPSTDKGLANTATFSFREDYGKFRACARACLNQVRHNKVVANKPVQTMNQAGFQQAGSYSAPLPDQQTYLGAQHSDDLEDSSLTLTDRCDYEWNSMGCSQIATNVPGQAIPLFNPQPHSSPEPHSGLIRHGYAGYTESSMLGRSPDAHLPLRAADAECQFPANDQSFQQNLLPWPQPKAAAKLNSIPNPYGDTSYESLLGFEQMLTAGDALATQCPGEPYTKPRPKSSRCTRCWALRKPVNLFIKWHLNWGLTSY